MEQAKRLTGRWPNGRPDNPGAYFAGLSEILVRYPPAVVDDCCDMNTGLPSRLQFLPTGRDVKEFCEARLAHYTTVARANPEQIARARQEVEHRALPPPDQSPAERATMAERFRALIDHLMHVKSPASARAAYLADKRETALTKGPTTPLPTPGAEEAA